jgi:uncharacterized protein with HEPN domain
MSAVDRNMSSVWDMVQAIRYIQEYTAEITLDEYLQSVLIQDAVERRFEILGEAARRISFEFREAHPAIDWRGAVGLRNVIIHRYEEVEQEELWNFIETILPNLLEQLEALLATSSDDPDRPELNSPD